ncbi:HNH endonuclease signature motif containing protein [Nocardioides sp.]|uniref:HNH endonuclease signature motif containing protein n=1 Tax=Nocardioides sp. TaxID=35761 RepID=UPI00378434CA
MTTTAGSLPIDRSDHLVAVGADELLALCADTERQAREAELRRLECALRWAHLHPDDPDRAALGSVESAAVVDAALAPRAHRCGTVLIDRAIAEATAGAEPEEQGAEEALSRSHWGVELLHGPMTGPGRWAGTSRMEITGDTVVLQGFLDVLTALAEGEVARTHPDDTIDVRRSLAVGLVAQRTSCDRPPRIKLHLHADLAGLLDDTIGTGSVERLGPITTARIKEWCGSSSVTVLPVLREDRTDAVDQHDPPPWMRELVTQRDGHCVFPWCATDARSCDLDHIEEYVPMDEGGPPGQTRPDALAPLCRHHHRAKTARRWRYRRLPDDSYLWTGPHGRRYRVDRDGTDPLS